ncbi:MAG: hypothetical protein [Circular genetic element sp.]|nr:MAG: hypothetical protein [Circular genetic element sp.]
MPINEIRDTIQGTVTIGDDGRGYMTRLINVQEGFRNEILSIDVFNDNLTFRNVEGYTEATAYQVYVSPYPIQPTNELWGPQGTQLPNSGPMAGDEQVFFKMQEMTKSSVLNTGNLQPLNQFPSPQVAATATNTWYSPHLYLTVLLWGQETIECDVKLSLFCRVKQTKANRTSVAMGQYKEFLDSQCRLLTSTMVSYDPLDIPGYTFPMWKYGGIRPELMISGTTALRYFNRVAAASNQEMTTRGDLESAFQAATNMVNFDAAFGDPALNLPEWITLMDVSGVTSGPIRQYPPPLKFFDNGNTMML